MKARRLESLAHCEKLVASLVEMLLRCEEQDASLIAALEAKHTSTQGGVSGGGGSGQPPAEGSQAQAQGSQATQGGLVSRSLRDHLVAVVVTIAVFCEAHPPFSARHLTVLLPYLKGTMGVMLCHLTSCHHSSLIIMSSYTLSCITHYLQYTFLSYAHTSSPPHTHTYPHTHTH